MGTKCVSLVADLFLFCYERDFVLSVSDNNQSEVIHAFNSTFGIWMTYWILTITSFRAWSFSYLPFRTSDK